MKLLSFTRNGATSYGAVLGDGVFDLQPRLGVRYPSLRYALVAEAQDQIRRLLDGATVDFALADIAFLPPVTDPEKLICVGRNYGEHVKEGNNAATERPMLFPRYPSAQVGHGQSIVRPFVSDRLDYEGELAVVIGRTARHVPASRALEYVAGYTCFNDGSVRDWQKHTHQLMQGKTFWRSGAIGPWIVTADEIPDPAALTLSTRVNGVELQNSSTGKMIFDIPYLIEYLSTIIDLQPGDIIATGTPEGVGLHRKPPIFLKQGDVVEITLSSIGTLRNPVIDERRPA